MPESKKHKAQEQINEYGKSQTPFLFILDYDLEKPIITPLHAVNNNLIKYDINDDFLTYKNYYTVKRTGLSKLKINKAPLRLEVFKRAFDLVLKNLKKGNSFLTNLTAETPIKSNWDIETLFHHCEAKYKLYLKNEFICFSPETFIQIDEDGKLSSFPMKGTIDTAVPNAETVLLADKKESYEHNTIVDLIRNDISKVAKKVWVERFKFIDRIKKEDGKELLQVSSEVCGELPQEWKSNLGDILFSLLPAGSISGAPKPKTLEIIKEAEKETFKNAKRGYYTGVFGVFDGKRLSSAVMIRFIEETKNGLVFKSGGGITSRSDAKKEYEEMISKIYVPVL